MSQRKIAPKRRFSLLSKALVRVPSLTRQTFHARLFVRKGWR
nr:MAG TPA: hypothetical protein [Caudoviricetes sp.]